MDAAGNIYFTNGTKVSKWTAATQALSDLSATGNGQVRGLALDNSGNVYFADAPNSILKVWNAASQQVTNLVSTGLNRSWGVALDSNSGDVYFSDSQNTAIKKWSATSSNPVTTLVQGTQGNPLDAVHRYRGVSFDSSGNLYFAAFDANFIGQLAKAYVSSGSRSEPSTAGTGALPPVIPTTTDLTGTFVPASDQPWLTIGTVANGIVNFSFAANGTGSPRTGHITVVGVQFTVNQGLQVGVPDVVGQAQVSAATGITGAGLVAGTVTTASSSTVAVGSVISTSPVAGTQVNFGSAVNLVVSTGPVPALEITGQFTITRGAAVLNRATGRIRNPSPFRTPVRRSRLRLSSWTTSRTDTRSISQPV